jgi:hypothetical protein
MSNETNLAQAIRQLKSSFGNIEDDYAAQLISAFIQQGNPDPLKAAYDYILQFREKEQLQEINPQIANSFLNNYSL